VWTLDFLDLRDLLILADLLDPGRVPNRGEGEKEKKVQGNATNCTGRALFMGF
jgi:hypothetical protein